MKQTLFFPLAAALVLLSGCVLTSEMTENATACQFDQDCVGITSDGESMCVGSHWLNLVRTAQVEESIVEVDEGVECQCIKFLNESEERVFGSRLGEIIGLSYGKYCEEK